MPRVLLGSDTLDIRIQLTRLLEDNGFEVLQSKLDSQVLLSRDENWVDVIVLEMFERFRTALSLTRQIRARSQIGIILVHLTADPEHAVQALELGADDVIRMPSQARELIARIRSLVRRTKNLSNGSSNAEIERVIFDGWTLYTEQRRLIAKDGCQVDLTAAEYDLLVIFLWNPCRILSRDQILMSLKGRPWQASDRSLDILVGRLRKKLENRVNGSELIKSVRSVGYVFCMTKGEIHMKVARPPDES